VVRGGHWVPDDAARASCRPPVASGPATSAIKCAQAIRAGNDGGGNDDDGRDINSVACEDGNIRAGIDPVENGKDANIWTSTETCSVAEFLSYRFVPSF
jgi:hypothetical protein